MAVRSSSGKFIRISLGMPSFPGALFLARLRILFKNLDLSFRSSSIQGPFEGSLIKADHSLQSPDNSRSTIIKGTAPRMLTCKRLHRSVQRFYKAICAFQEFQLWSNHHTLRHTHCSGLNHLTISVLLTLGSHSLQCFSLESHRRQEE